MFTMACSKTRLEIADYRVHTTGCKSIWGGLGSTMQKSGKKRNTGSKTKWRMSKHNAWLAGATAKREGFCNLPKTPPAFRFLRNQKISGRITWSLSSLLIWESALGTGRTAKEVKQ